MYQYNWLVWVGLDNLLKKIKYTEYTIFYELYKKKKIKYSNIKIYIVILKNKYSNIKYSIKNRKNLHTVIAYINELFLFLHFAMLFFLIPFHWHDML